jgi:two-component system LytT family response regulator
MNFNKKSLYKTIIIDDELLAIEGLQIHLKLYTQFNIITTFRRVSSALEWLKENDIDVIFLDIEMPKYNGFDFIKMYNPKKMPTLIFVTAYNQFALEAFNANALDYILKPIDVDRFETTIKKIESQLSLLSVETDRNKLKKLVSDLEKKQLAQSSKIKLKSFGTHYFVEYSDIILIQSEGDYINVITTTNTYFVKKTLTQFESGLNDDLFKRIHRSTIVNTQKITELKPSSHGDGLVILSNKVEVKFTRSYRKNLESVINSITKSSSSI